MLLTHRRNFAAGLRTLLFVALSGAVAQSAQSAVVFSSGNYGDVATLGNYVPADLGTPSANHTGYQLFSLPVGLNTVRQVTFYGGYQYTETADDFVFKVYDSINLPGQSFPNDLVATPTILQVDRELTGLSYPPLILDPVNPNVPVYRYTAYISDLTLAPGTDYWFGIANNSGGGWLLAMNQKFIFPLTNDNIIDMGSVEDFVTIGGSSDDRPTSWYPLTLSNDIHNVPEPGAACLFAIGIATIGIASRRKFRAALSR